MKMLQAALGGGKQPKSPKEGGLQYPSNTPEVLQCAMSIMEGYCTHAVPEGRLVMMSDSAFEWLEGEVWCCQPPDPDVTQRFLRMASQYRRCEGFLALNIALVLPMECCCCAYGARPAPHPAPPDIGDLHEKLMSPGDGPTGVVSSRDDVSNVEIESGMRHASSPLNAISYSDLLAPRYSGIRLFCNPFLNHSGIRILLCTVISSTKPPLSFHSSS